MSGQSRYRLCVQLTLVMLCVFAVLSWQPGHVAWQGVWQFCLLVLLLLWAWRHWHSSKQDDAVISLSETGQWSELSAPEQVQQWQITRHSRVSSLLIWLQLLPTLSGEKTEPRWLWVYRDQLPERDFRRLAKIVVRCQKGKHD